MAPVGMEPSIATRMIRTLKVSRVLLGSRRKVTRAHVELARRPEVVSLGQDFLQKVCQRLGGELGGQLLGRARVVAGALDSPASSSGRVGALLELTALQDQGILEVEPAFLGALLGGLAGRAASLEPVSRLTLVEEACLSYLLLVVLSELRKAPGLDALVGARLGAVLGGGAEEVFGADSQRSCVCVEVVLSLGEFSGLVRVFLPGRAFGRALAALPRSAEAPFAPELREATILVTLRAGSSSLGPEAVAALTVGDVVAPGGLRREGASLVGPGSLCVGGLRLCGKWAEQGFAVREVEHLEQKELALNEENKGTAQNADGLPIEVEIELGRVRVSLGELSGLRAGVVFPLGIDPDQPVTLRIGDRLVARAELVDVEGEVGARILALCR